ncbi:hypothetical protein AND_005893 [Anopheles darlingi]|uniref:Pre-rRNA-processing protein Ipi1 N-terminal domain-containing protein n=1 Tax=Anopheles darlingi TaxID=43151 RepID=W5JEE6_ANODA|nr:hypothetical protein AND_005893 [Anopheles darlingi]
MGGNSRKFKKAEKSKIKLKGAVLPKGTNVTKTNFKVRKIVLPDQLKQRNLTQAAVLSNKSLTLKDCLAKLRQNNASSKTEGLRGVREILGKMPSEVQSMLSNVIRDVTSLAVDLERDVRRDCYKTLGCILVACGPTGAVPFFDLLLSFLRCAMTHIQARIQEDSLLLLDVLLQHSPALILTNRDKILPQFLDMISKLRAENKPGRTLTINLDRQSTSTRWRANVLMRLTAILKILLESKVAKDCPAEANVGESEAAEAADLDNPFASAVAEQQLRKGPQLNHVFDGNGPMFLPLIKSHLCTTCPMDVLFRKTAEKDSGLSLSERVDDGQKLKMYIEMLIPLLFESWLEVRPPVNEAVEEHALSQEAASTLDLLLTIFIQLWKLTVQYCAETNNNDLKQWFRGQYSSNFASHILKGFPYYQSGSQTQTQPKKARTTSEPVLERVDDKCYKQNFNICFFFCCLNEQFRSIRKRKSDTGYTRVVEYVKSCVLNWKFRGVEATNLLLQVLRFILLDADSTTVNEETRALLNTLLEVYITARLPQDIRNRILVLFCDIIVRSDTLWRQYGKELFTLWLKMLPNLLCKPTIDMVVLRALLCLAQRNNAAFLDVLEANAKQIVANAGTIRVTNEREPGEGRALICNLIFYIRDRSLLQELLAVDCAKVADRSVREQLLSTVEMRCEMLK